MNNDNQGKRSGEGRVETHSTRSTEGKADGSGSSGSGQAQKTQQQTADKVHQIIKKP